ncbi:putative periplasmic tail-specific proteinase [Blattabacterium sp. (Periplaneta americana) str. BPLAN]|uniref:carboxy terminal-processing peptidase n=1 Tax=Blattabacterium sp. (Periplaneta americana) TaxID=367488 RepID=UPI0001BA0B87|nr:carboxy terminal-processing peptidase [Blattabacterium sp. (Periplaneta americana)]ACX83777.1 putative periplasmic tail-specific proteinase [Blattabacterium sp. (Periplaneta americana) str. BPLAN]
MIVDSIRNFKYIIIGFIFTFLLSFCSPQGEEETHRIILKTIYKTLYFLHPNPIKINNEFSQKVYKQYFSNLDLQKRFFLQKDLEDISFYREKLDESWIHGDPTFFNITMKCFSQRIKEVENICSKILKKPFNFHKREVYIPGEQKISYPKNKKEWIEEWRKYLKYLTLIEIVSPENPQGNIWKSLKKNIRWMNQEKEARKKVEEYMQEYFRKLKMKKKTDWFSMYVNTITSQYDPHTNYFSPKEKENFDLNISGKTEGIGAELQDHKGYATIVKLLVDGPAWKSKQIEVGDKIIKVAKDINSESKNIIGMLLENSIRLIRGKKGSKVKLTIQKKDGSIKEVILIRDIIEKKEIFARSVTILDNENKYGLIFLPEFYFNPENKNGRNAAQDMKKIIQELKKEKIKGLIIDIRNNGGGSLETVIEIAGFFLGKVPIVQVGLSSGRKKILKNKNNELLWKGPLVILVNELSASASEILAASIADYKRGIIVGSYQTYGKGTVQTFYPLNRFLFSKKELGALKFTMNKFYRVNGSSTQLKGVNPDIVIPNNISCLVRGMEKDQPNSMMWDRTDSISYQLWKGKIDLEKIKLKSINRLKKYQDMMTIYQTIQLLEKNFLNKKYIPLNWKDFWDENLKMQKINANFQALKNYLNVYELRAFPPSYQIISKLDQEWKKNLLNDFHIEECVNILRDFNENPLSD